MRVKSEFLGDGLAAWKKLPKSYLVLGLFLLLLGLFSGFFLSAVYRSDRSAFPKPDKEILPIGIRIFPEPERKRTSAVHVFPIEKPAPTTIGPEENHETPVAGPESGAVPPETKEGTEPVAEAVKEPLTIQAGTTVSGRVVDEDLKKISQKEIVDQEGIDKILATADFRIYTTAKEDTLWRIAEKCYGSGYYFPILMECNPSLHIYDMEGGIPVRILRDNRLVQRLYNKITRLIGNRLYFYYRVAAGDTFDSIARKFYNKEGQAERIKELNPHAELVPGSRIKIGLD